MKKKSLKGNQLQHTDTRPTYACELCTRIFTSLYGLRRHAKSKHSTSGRRQFNCTFVGCPATFLTAIGPSNHIKIEHIKDPARFPCTHCGKEFKLQGYLNAHISRHTIGPTRLPCRFPGCEKTFLNKRYVAEHFNTYHVANPLRFPCILCGKEFKCKMNLRRHIGTHTKEKSFKCVTCGASFAQKSVLMAHQNTHLDISERTVFPCKVCPRTFLSNSSLWFHTKYDHVTVTKYS